MEHLPPWLRNLPLPTPPAGHAETAPPPSAGADEEVPEWLRDLRREVSDEARTGSTETPEWLRDLRREVSDEARTGSAEAPEWLRDLRREVSDEARTGSAEAPEWLRDVEPPSAPPPAAPSPRTPPLGATSWLSDLGHDKPEAPTEPASAADQPTTSSRVKMPVGATDWLRSIGQDPDAPSEPLSGPISEPLDASGLPDWLRDLNADEVARAVEGETPPHDRPIAETPSADASTVPTQRSPSAPTPPSTESLPEEPDWLREFMAPEKQKAPPPPEAHAADDAEVPTWLREIAEASEGSPESDRSVAAPEEESELPTWLRDAAQAEAPAGGEEIPAWLREAAEAPQPPASADVPAWLRDAAQAEAPAGGEEIPAWLQEAAEAPQPPTGADVPAWLQEAAEAPQPPASADVPAWLQEAAEAPQPPAGADVPAWLQEAPEAQAPQAEAPPVASDLPPWLVTAESVQPGPVAAGAGEPVLPAWLHGAPAESAPSPSESSAESVDRARRPPEEDESPGFLRGAELPGWLRVPEPELPAETAAGQQLDWLRRLGGIEAEESLVEAPVAAAVARPRPVYHPTAEQLGAMRLLQQLVATPYPAPAPAPAPVERAEARLNLHRVLYALLALALLIALLAPQITAPFRPTAPVTGNAAALGALLDSLDSDDVVLMAYEWAAQRSGELRPLEEAVTRRLIANRTRLILVSTDLQGTLLSFDVIEPLRAAGYNNENGVSFGGRDYVLLGYRPGGELAVRGLAQDLRGALTSDFDGQDASQGLVANYPDGTPRISGMEDLALIVVLADQPQDVQVWMEQAHRQVRDQVPIAFLLPQDAQPLAQPYLRLPNVYAIAGQQGALALLATDPTADPDNLSRATGQLAFAVVVFVVLLLLGAAARVLMRQREAPGGAT